MFDDQEFAKQYEQDVITDFEQQKGALKDLSKYLFTNIKSISSQREKIFNIIADYHQKNHFTQYTFDEIKNILNDEFGSLNKELSSLDKITQRAKTILDLEETDDDEDEIAIDDLETLTYVVKSNQEIYLEIYSDTMEELEEITEELFFIEEFEDGQNLKTTLNIFNKLIDEHLITVIAKIRVLIDDYSDDDSDDDEDDDEDDNE